MPSETASNNFRQLPWLKTENLCLEVFLKLTFCDVAKRTAITRTVFIETILTRFNLKISEQFFRWHCEKSSSYRLRTRAILEQNVPQRNGSDGTIHVFNVRAMFKLSEAICTREQQQ